MCGYGLCSYGAEESRVTVCCRDGNKCDIQSSESSAVRYSSALGCCAVLADKFVFTDIAEERTGLIQSSQSRNPRS